MEMPTADFTSLLGNQEQHDSSPARPERNLLAALMGRAICDAFGTAHCEKHIIRSAQRWLFSKLTPKRPFSFAWTALALDLDPSELQRKLKALSPEQMSQRINVLRS